MNASAASANDCTIARLWMMMRSRRLSDRSAITPAHAPNSSTGRNWHAVMIPTATPLWVMCRTSSVWATSVIQLPAWEIVWPSKNSRKLRTCSDRNVACARPGNRSARRAYCFAWLTNCIPGLLLRALGRAGSAPARSGLKRIRYPRTAAVTDAARMPSLASLARLPSNASSVTSSDTVKPMPPSAPTPKSPRGRSFPPAARRARGERRATRIRRCPRACRPRDRPRPRGSAATRPRR